MRLSGIIFLIIGVIVAVASFFMFQSGQKMMLFIYAGIAMAVFGGIRMFIDRGSGDADREHENLQKKLDAYQQHHVSDIPRVCGTCGTKNHPRANFCGNCGNKL